MSGASARNARALELASLERLRIPNPPFRSPRKVAFKVFSQLMDLSWSLVMVNPCKSHDIPQFLLGESPNGTSISPTSCHGASPLPPLKPSWVPWPRGSPGPPHRFLRPRRHSKMKCWISVGCCVLALHLSLQRIQKQKLIPLVQKCDSLTVLVGMSSRLRSKS